LSLRHPKLHGFLPEINAEKKGRAGFVIAGLTCNLNPRIHDRLMKCGGLRIKPAMTDGVVTMTGKIKSPVTNPN
jgi:hypothetical protein